MMHEPQHPGSIRLQTEEGQFSIKQSEYNSDASDDFFLVDVDEKDTADDPFILVNVGGKFTELEVSKGIKPEPNKKPSTQTQLERADASNRIIEEKRVANEVEKTQKAVRGALNLSPSKPKTSELAESLIAMSSFTRQRTRKGESLEPLQKKEAEDCGGNELDSESSSYFNSVCPCKCVIS